MSDSDHNDDIRIHDREFYPLSDAIRIIKEAEGLDFSARSLQNKAYTSMPKNPEFGFRRGKYWYITKLSIFTSWLLGKLQVRPWQDCVGDTDIKILQNAGDSYLLLKEFSAKSGAKKAKYLTLQNHYRSHMDVARADNPDTADETVLKRIGMAKVLFKRSYHILVFPPVFGKFYCKLEHGDDRVF